MANSNISANRKSQKQLQLTRKSHRATRKTPELLLFIVFYPPPGPCTELLSDFFYFLFELVLITDKVIIVGDFNIHVDV